MNHPIDVIVPVYRGLQDVIDCLDSVKHAHYEKTFELIVIDDCSPEPEVSALLQVRAKEDGFTLLVNEENLGFVATVNRGMRLHPERDVLLLNSDTLVANDWLDRIATAAYSDTNVGTVTPFSNNATICSYPAFCQDNDLPSNTPLKTLDDLCATVNRQQTVEVPTGVGFCMYIRRHCLDEVGYFDVDTFGKGYGEENDFCQRALKAGWKNLFALDVFVQHTGNVSFGDEHNELKHTALGKLVQHHPNYERDVHQHLSEDPARLARVKIWLASLVSGTQPIVVHVCHGSGGGTLRFVNELSTEIEQSFYSILLRPSVSQSGVLALTMIQEAPNGHPLPESEYTLFFDSESHQAELVSLLALLPIAGFHYHHLLGLPQWVAELAKMLDKPWLVSLHDYYYLSQSISLTDQNGVFIGHDLADVTPEWTGQFTSFLAGASTCVAPSKACQALYQQVFPEAQIIPLYHEQAVHSDWQRWPVQPIAANKQTLHVLIIGALSQIKGADLLEQVALLCATADIDIQFELIGYSYRDFDTTLATTLSVTGSYQEQDLDVMLQARKTQRRADVIWFPAIWPETYSYTLSAAIESGLPIIAPNLGAFPERLGSRDYSWVVPWDATPDVFLTMLQALATGGSDNQGRVLSDLQNHTSPAPQTLQYKSDYARLFGSSAMIATQDNIAMKTLQGENIDPFLELALPYTGVQVHCIHRMRLLAFNLLYRLRQVPLMRSLTNLIPASIRERIRQRLSR